MNIVLIGTIAAGKTVIGRALAQMTGYKFVDTDELSVSKIGSKIMNLFGYTQAFCNAEAEVIAEVANQDNLVIATGALVASHPGAISKLRENGIIIRLLPDLETVINRVKRDGTKFLMREGDSYEKAVEEDYTKYVDQYSDYDYSIDVSDAESPEAYARKILDLVEKK